MVISLCEEKEKTKKTNKNKKSADFVVVLPVFLVVDYPRRYGHSRGMHGVYYGMWQNYWSIGDYGVSPYGTY